MSANTERVITLLHCCKHSFSLKGAIIITNYVIYISHAHGMPVHQIGELRYNAAVFQAVINTFMVFKVPSFIMTEQVEKHHPFRKLHVFNQLHMTHMHDKWSGKILIALQPTIVQEE